MTTFLYDSGTLVAIDKRQGEAVRRHEARLARGHHILVPAPVAAQVVRAPRRQERLMFALRGCRTLPFEKKHVAPVGMLLAESGTSDVVDGFVAVAAAEANAAVVTSDTDDIRRLLRLLGIRLAVLPP
ncbi:MAG TPA: PIN domain-containing protein [Streptosporangiaceae bacterium]